MTIFRRPFRCRTEFNNEFNGLVLRRSDLERPNLRADADMADHARDLIASVPSPALRTAAQDVEQAIMLLLPAGRATIQNCADAMGLTVRTLQRMLDADQTSFTDLLNRARMQLSAQYLANPRTRIADVAELLGYSSIGAFSRWHGQMFGVSPRKNGDLEIADKDDSQPGHDPRLPRSVPKTPSVVSICLWASSLPAIG